MHGAKRTTFCFYLIFFLSFLVAFLGGSDGRVLHSSLIAKAKGHQLLRKSGFMDLASRAQMMGWRSLASEDRVAPGGPDPQHH
ncbi:hypothetical protein NL676_017394 [Syzygium grande]|nr:hypothetical protein NL676_017394 [Syzygium grande]